VQRAQDVDVQVEGLAGTAAAERFLIVWLPPAIGGSDTNADSGG
jgi:hypothetical protein